MSAPDPAAEPAHQDDSLAAVDCDADGRVAPHEDRRGGNGEAAHGQADGKVEGAKKMSGAAGSSREEEDDMSKKYEGCFKKPKSVSSNSKRLHSNPTRFCVNYVRDDNLGNVPPSKSRSKKASEMSNGDVSKETSQRRPRSLSPGIEYESVNKRPEIICSFFAKGWCIRGNSCKFLHKNEGIGYTSQVTKEENSTIEDLMDCKGSEMVEKSSVSMSIDIIGKPILKDSINSQFQRALVRTYGGGETHGLSQLKDGDNFLRSRASFAVDELRQKPIFQETNPRNLGLIPYFDSIGDRHSASGEIPSKKYLNEGMLYKEMLRGEPRNYAPFSREASFTKNPLTSELNYLSGGSSTITSIYKDSSGIYSYDTRPDNLAGQCQQSHFTAPDSYNSCSTSSIKSSFGSPLHLLQGSPSIGPLPLFAQSGTRLSHESPTVNAEHEGNPRALNCSRGFCNPTSGQQSTAGDPLSFSGQKQKLEEYTWENSVPFRPSFCCAPFIKSSTGIQYDPLVDSADHPKEGITAPASPSGIVEGMLSHHTVAASVLAGDCLPGFDVKKSANSLSHVGEGLLGTKASPHENCGYTNTAAPCNPNTIDGGSDFTAEEEKNQVPELPDSAHVNKVELGRDMREIDKAKDTESKVVKMFHAALVEFVKELLKPFWKEGLLSKDSHKLIVKKVVEKVLSSLQPHQAPSGMESISQYLSSSKPKLLKLVEAYVDKYGKS